MLLDLLLLAVVCFFQNMAFTWSSRSRNSGDPNYHRYAAWCSNGIYIICHLLVLKQIWSAFQGGGVVALIAACIVYVFATTEGSVFMMRILLRKEKGKHRVGSR